MIITIEIKQRKEDPELLDKVLGRIYTLDSVEDVKLIETKESENESEGH